MVSRRGTGLVRMKTAVPSSISEPRAEVPMMRQASGRIVVMIMPLRRTFAVHSCWSKCSLSL
jgi:hypothetical protein